MANTPSVNAAVALTSKRATSHCPSPNATSARPRSQSKPLGVAPSFAVILLFVYGFILWTIYLSFTNSKTFPNYTLTDARAYQRLWTWTFQSDPVAVHNIALTGTEVRYLVENEWAQKADDILWRRTKLGLVVSRDQRAALEKFVAELTAA